MRSHLCRFLASRAHVVAAKDSLVTQDAFVTVLLGVQILLERREPAFHHFRLVPAYLVHQPTYLVAIVLPLQYKQQANVFIYFKNYIESFSSDDIEIFYFGKLRT